MTVLKLPPYHFEFNPIELGWAVSKKWAAARCEFSMAALFGHINVGLAQMTPELCAKFVRHAKVWEAEFLVADEERFGVTGEDPQRPCASKVCSTHASDRQASAKNEAKKALLSEKRACVGCSEFFHSTCWRMEDGLGRWEEGEAEMYCGCVEREVQGREELEEEEPPELLPRTDPSDPVGGESSGSDGGESGGEGGDGESDFTGGRVYHYPLSMGSSAGPAGTMRN